MARKPSPPKTKTVLLVDDEILWLDAVRSALSGAPVKLITAPGGEQALEALKTARPDLILSDVRMPAMNGFDLYDRVRNQPDFRSVPFVFMSSIDDFDARKIARELGADGYIEKPFDVDGVKAILADLLGRFYDK